MTADISPASAWHTHGRRIGRSAASALVATSLLLSGVVAFAAPASAAENHTPTAPTGLRTELLSDAVVVDTLEPSLSWVVNDEDPNEVQTAYRIVFARSAANAESGDYVHDTGWQTSAQSSSVEAPGLAGKLLNDSLYYWQVQTKDREGAESPLSTPEAFNTATDWVDTRGAWLEYAEDETPADANRFYSVGTGQSSPGSLLSLDPGSGSGVTPAVSPAIVAPATLSQWTNYTFEADITTGTALGVIFRRSGSKDLMWQFRSSGIGSNANQVCTHTGTAYAQLGCSPATIPANTAAHITITAINDVVSTRVNGTLVDTRTVADFAAGTIGFRTGSSESGRVDNIVVRNVSTGRTIYADDFSTATGTAGYTGSVSVASGALNVPAGQSGGAVLALTDDVNLGTGVAAHPGSITPAAASEWTNYSIDADVRTASALGIVFRDNGSENYMWQFKPSNNTLNYHAGRDYAGAAPANPASPALPSGTLVPDKWFHLRIEAAGSTIRSYIDGKLVGTVSNTNATAGTIGLRTGSTESARLDNLVVQQLDTGKYLYAQDAQQLPLGQSADFAGVTVAAEQQTDMVFPKFMFLRHAFELQNADGIERAVVSASGFNTQSSLASMADLFVNGAALGTYPARTHTGAAGGTQQYYNSYDVTEQLRDGENVIASLAYNRDAARAVLLQLTVWRTDGTKQVITNSARDADEWHAFDGTPVFGDTLQARNGAYYDQHAENLVAAAYPTGFDTTDFAESAAWHPVRVSASINGSRVLAPFAAENTERHWMPAESVTDRGNGTYVVTLEKEIIGSLELQIDAPAARAITVKYAENLNTDGSIRLGGAGSGSYPPYQETWKLDPGKQTLRTYLMKNFRYLQIENSPVPITTEMVRGWAMRTSFDEDASSFSSSDTFLERLYEYTKYSMQATNQDLWVDSQARERGAYEGDLIVNFDASSAVSADYSLARHSGEYLINNQTWPAEYKLFSVEAAWLDYLHTGNSDSLNDYYTKIKAKLNPSTDTSASGTFSPTQGLVRTVGDTGSGNRVLVDWPTGEQDGYVAPNPGYSAPYNAIYVGAAQAMANIAGALGNTADQALWHDRADTVKANLIAKLYNPSIGAFADSMKDEGTVSTHFAQHSTAYALAYGIYDSPEMAAKLSSYLDGQGGFKGSIYASHFVLRGLFGGDGGDTGLRFLLNPDSANRRTFAHVLDVLKATISPEAWDPALKGNMTMSHPWGAAPGSAIAHGMFGINPTSPGYEKFAVKFQPGNVQDAAITVPTLRGAVEASFDNSTSLFAGTVTVPANTTATVSLPAENPGFVNLAVDGKTVPATRAGGFLSVELGSGTHTVAVSPEGAQLYVVSLNSSADSVYATKKLATSLAVTDESEAAADLDGATISYESSDPSLATVDGQGVVTGIAAGEVTIKATVSKGIRTGFASLRLRIDPAPKITSLEVRAPAAKIGDLFTPQLVGHSQDGSETVFTDVTFESSDPTVAAVRDDGSVQVKRAGTFSLKASTSQHFTDLAPDFDFSAFEITKLWSADFNDGVNPFTSGPANPSVVNGRLYVDKSKNSLLPIGSNWGDYILTFTGEAVAGTSTNPLGDGLPVLLRATSNTPPGDNYYWQVFSSNTLKRGAGIAEAAPVNISNVRPAGTANRIAIAAEGNRFMTYVNGKLVDTWTDSTHATGTIGVRTGGTDARYYLDDLVVGTRVLTETTTFTIAADTAAIDALVTAADGLTNVLSGFTDASASAFRAALAAAKLIAADPQAHTQAEVDAASSALQSAISGLELKPEVTPAADATVLRTLVDGALTVTNPSGRYTATTWEALQAAITAAQLVLDDPAATQSEIDRAATALGTALVGLELAKAPVAKPVYAQKIKLNQKQLSLVKGQRFTLRAGVYSSNGRAAYSGKVTWKSSNTRIATVNSAGTITAKNAGKVTITATSKDKTSAGRKLSTSAKVKVVKKKPKAKVTRVATTPQTPKRLAVGAVAYITGTYSSSRTTGVKVSYSSSKPSVLAVDRAGRLVAKQAGSAYITVHAGAKSARYRVAVG